MSERTFEPTGRKLEELKKRGDVALSPDLTSAITLYVGITFLASRMPEVTTGLLELMRKCFTGLGKVELAPEGIQQAGMSVLSRLSGPWLPFLLLLAGCGALVTLVQTRGLISSQRVTPDFSRINPFTGIKKLFSAQGFFETAKGIVKMAVLSIVLYTVVKAVPAQLSQASLAGLGPAIAVLGEGVLGVAKQAALVLVVIGALDYVIKARQYKQRSKMTREEVTQDMKNSEGQPLLRQKLRELQRRMSRGRMMQQIPSADVIITNPTHLAIAIRYEVKKMAAPVVVAKGRDLVAQEIVRRAREHNVPIVQNVPLAHALIKVELEAPVPVALYQAVAEVLAFVYRTRRNRPAPTAVGARP